MKIVEITEDFTGYPAGKKTQFKKGETPELANDFADLIVGKGHARAPEKRTTTDSKKD